MKVALGFKAHSGWAALVAIGKAANQFVVVDRRRIELVRETDVRWAKQPYHAAEDLESDEARGLIERVTKSAHREAEREIREAVKRLLKDKHEVAACAILAPNPMPDWTVSQILAVHFRMHQAEGVMFPAALVHAADKCGLKVATIPEKTLDDYATKVTRTSLSELKAEIGRLGKTVGPPWASDQKNAALTAISALAQLDTDRKRKR